MRGSGASSGHGDSAGERSSFGVRRVPEADQGQLDPRVALPPVRLGEQVDRLEEASVAGELAGRREGFRSSGRSARFEGVSYGGHR